MGSLEDHGVKDDDGAKEDDGAREVAALDVSAAPDEDGSKVIPMLWGEPRLEAPAVSASCEDAPAAAAEVPEAESPLVEAEKLVRLLARLDAAA